METTIRINTDALTPDIIDGIKKLFPHTEVNIIIQAADTTNYILSNPAFAQELNDRISEYEIKKKKGIIIQTATHKYPCGDQVQ